MCKFTKNRLGSDKICLFLFEMRFLCRLADSIWTPLFAFSLFVLSLRPQKTNKPYTMNKKKVLGISLLALSLFACRMMIPSTFSMPLAHRLP